jgi:hypothetical protein
MKAITERNKKVDEISRGEDTLKVVNHTLH